jgi:hypothetical protein
LSADIKTDNVSGAVGLVQRADIGWVHDVTYDHMEGREIKGTSDWANYSTVIDIPEDCDNFYIAGYLEEKGKAWFKNFKLEEVSKDVPTTGKHGLLSKEPKKKTVSRYDKKDTDKAPVNPSFDDKRTGTDSVNKDSPFGWYLGGTAPKNYKLSLETSNASSGSSKCASMQSIKLDAEEFGTLMQTIDAEKYRGKRMRLGADIKTKDADSAALWMRIDGESGETLGFDNMDNRRIKGTSDWTRYECVLDVPADSEFIAFGVLMEVGQVWFTNVTLEEVSQDVKSTNMERNRPLNMDFEED